MGSLKERNPSAIDAKEMSSAISEDWLCALLMIKGVTV